MPGSTSGQDALPEIKTAIVELCKSEDGFGLSITGGIDNPHFPGENEAFISSIKKGGVADLDGQLSVGDRIVLINGVATGSQTHDELVQLFAKNVRVELVVEKNAEMAILESTPIHISSSTLTSLTNFSMFKSPNGSINDLQSYVDSISERWSPNPLAHTEQQSPVINDNSLKSLVYRNRRYIGGVVGAGVCVFIIYKYLQSNKPIPPTVN